MENVNSFENETQEDLKSEEVKKTKTQVELVISFALNLDE